MISATVYAMREIARKRRERREYEIEPDLAALNLRRCSLAESEADVEPARVDSAALLSKPAHVGRTQYIPGMGFVYDMGRASQALQLLREVPFPFIVKPE